MQAPLQQSRCVSPGTRCSWCRPAPSMHLTAEPAFTGCFFCFELAFIKLGSVRWGKKKKKNKSGFLASLKK